MMEEHEARAKALQDALMAGHRSGEPRPFDSKAFLSRMHAQHPHGYCRLDAWAMRLRGGAGETVRDSPTHRFRKSSFQ